MKRPIFYIDTHISEFNDVNKTALKCFHKMWSGLGVDELLHLAIVLINSSLKNGSCDKVCIDRLSSNMLGLKW